MSDRIVQAVIEAGLADKEIKQAVLDYIRAATPSGKHWREIYRKISTEVRVLELDMPNPFSAVRPYRQDVALFMVVTYSDERQVARIDAYLRHPQSMSESGIFFPETQINTDTLANPYYNRVIDQALERWPAYLAEFEQRTQPKQGDADE